MNYIFKTVFAFILILIGKLSSAQSGLPDISVTSNKGIAVPLKSIIDTNTVTIISFWATWCVPCINELDALQDKGNGEKINSFKLIAISTDEARTVHRVKILVITKEWSFDVYLDESNEVKRAFNVSNIPFIIVLNKGKIVYQRSGYVPGDEEILLDKIEQLSAGN